MKIVFTRNNSIMSRLIRYVTGEPVSHVVIVTDGIVLHSNLLGVNIQPLSSFKSELVYEVPIPSNYTKLLQLYAKYQHSSYDILAMLYLGISLLLRRVGIPMPKSNLWQVSGMFMCTEFITKYTDNIESSMITPYKLYQGLLPKENN